MIDINKNDITNELLENPQQLLNNYNQLIDSIGVVVNVINQQIGFGRREENKYLKRLKKHKELISRMLQIQRSEMELFASCVKLCDEKIALGDDVEGIYRKQKRSLERLRQDDKKMLVKLQLGLREYENAIEEIQKIFDSMEE